MVDHRDLVLEERSRAVAVWRALPALRGELTAWQHAKDALTATGQTATPATAAPAPSDGVTVH